MGLSRKLGNVANQRGLNVPECLSVEYKWSTQSYTIRDIIDTFKLPCVVQCATDQCSILWSKFQFDFRYPLLLYSQRTVKKMHARNLTTSTQEEFGPPVAIPEDYEGWFGATPKGVNQTKRHTRIESIANSNTLRFLVSTKCPAFTRSLGPDGCLEYLSRDILPGETFKRVCVMDGDMDDPDTPDIVKFNGPCLECLDEKDDDVVIPFSRRAIAFEISECYPDTNHNVFNVKPMVSAGNSKLPRIISLVHGERPLLDYAFTGVLRCYSVFTEETVLAATLDDTSPVCLEMTTDSSARFKLSLNETSIKRTCEYNNAFQLCSSSGDAFLSGIKVSFSVHPEPEMDENDASTCEIQSTVSDMQEIDANSEFEIAWSSEQNTNSSKSSYKIKAIEKGNVSMSDNFILASNNSSQLPMNTTKVKCEPRQGSSVPVMEGDDASNPPSDFTEQEIADLMVRKGMIHSLGASSSSDLNLSEEIETLRRTRVKVNPIYYGGEPGSEITKDENKEDVPICTGIGNVADVSVESENENDDIVEISLDESEFGEAVCTRASEYLGDSEGEEESEVELSGEISVGACEEYSFNEVHKGNTETEELPISESSATGEESSRNSTNIDPSIKFNGSERMKSEVTDGAIEKDYSHEVRKLDTEFNELPVDVPSTNEDGSEIQRIRRAVSSDISPSGASVEFLHGLNVSNKATSSDMMNKKKWWNPKRKGEGTSILNKFKSESNISKIFDRLKGSDDGKSISSSKTKLLQLKPSAKSSSKNTTRNNTMAKDEEILDVIEC